MSQPPKLITVRDMALRLSCSTDTVTRLLRKKEAPGIKLGHDWRIDPEAFIAARSNLKPPPG